MGGDNWCIILVGNIFYVQYDEYFGLPFHASEITINVMLKQGLEPIILNLIIHVITAWANTFDVFILF